MAPDWPRGDMLEPAELSFVLTSFPSGPRSFHVTPSVGTRPIDCTLNCATVESPSHVKGNSLGLPSEATVPLPSTLSGGAMGIVRGRAYDGILLMSKVIVLTSTSLPVEASTIAIATPFSLPAAKYQVVAPS